METINDYFKFKKKFENEIAEICKKYGFLEDFSLEVIKKHRHYISTNQNSSFKNMLPKSYMSFKFGSLVS